MAEMTEKELEQLNSLFEDSEGKDSDYIDSLPEGTYLGTVTDCRMHESASTGNFMIKFSVEVKDRGIINSYLVTRGNTHYIERFKKITNDLKLNAKDVGTAFEQILGKQVAVISSDTGFISISADPEKLAKAE